MATHRALVLESTSEPLKLQTLPKPTAKVGEVVVTLDGKTIATQPVVAMEAVEETNFVVRLWHHLKRFLSNLF